MVTYCLGDIGISLGAGGSLHLRRCGRGLSLGGIRHEYESLQCWIRSGSQEDGGMLGFPLQLGDCLRVAIATPYTP